MSESNDSYTLAVTSEGIMILCNDGSLLEAEANDVDQHNYDLLNAAIYFKCWTAEANRSMSELAESAYDLGVERHYEYPASNEYNGLDPDRFFTEVSKREDYCREMRINCGVSQFGSILPI